MYDGQATSKILEEDCSVVSIHENKGGGGGLKCNFQNIRGSYSVVFSFFFQ